MSWMKSKKFTDKEREKISKGSGCAKIWTLLANWFFRAVSW
jgi:hypothetical protein